MVELSANLCGGLGNMMFTVATLHAYCKDNGCNYSVYRDRPNPHSKVDYHQNILRKVPKSKPNQKFKLYKDLSQGKYPLPIFKVNTTIYGYFQDPLYFDHIRDDIKSLYSEPDNISTYINEKYSDILDKDLVSLHIRRGDYLKLTYHPITKIEYYKKAYEIMGENKTYLIFSDDLGWSKSNLDFIKNKIFISENEVNSLYLMTRCEEHIIANSTFSWWGAYLSNYTKVIAPKIWLENKDWSRIYMKDWIIL